MTTPDLSDLYAPVMDRVARDPDVQAALAAGEISPAAAARIEAALVAEVEHRAKLRALILGDRKAQRALTRFHFARAYAAAKAEGAYRDAFDAALAAIPA
jgi:hypothetical protein